MKPWTQTIPECLEAAIDAIRAAKTARELQTANAAVVACELMALIFRFRVAGLISSKLAYDECQIALAQFEQLIGLYNDKNEYIVELDFERCMRAHWLSLENVSKRVRNMLEAAAR